MLIPSRIIKDSYIKVPLPKRPRIFGMTASPIDAKGDIVEAALYVLATNEQWPEADLDQET